MTSNRETPSVSGALLSLAFLPFTLVFALVKGVLIGLVALLTFGMFNA